MKMAHEWSKFYSKAGVLLFYFNTRTFEHRWPDWANDGEVPQFDSIKSTDINSDWMGFLCKSGELLFYYNKNTMEHRWPDFSVNYTYENAIPATGKSLYEDTLTNLGRHNENNQTSDRTIFKVDSVNGTEEISDADLNAMGCFTDWLVEEESDLPGKKHTTSVENKGLEITKMNCVDNSGNKEENADYPLENDDSHYTETTNLNPEFNTLRNNSVSNESIVDDVKKRLDGGTAMNVKKRKRASELLENLVMNEKPKFRDHVIDEQRSIATTLKCNDPQQSDIQSYCTPLTGKEFPKGKQSNNDSYDSNMKSNESSLCDASLLSTENSKKHDPLENQRNRECTPAIIVYQCNNTALLSTEKKAQEKQANVKTDNITITKPPETSEEEGKENGRQCCNYLSSNSNQKTKAASDVEKVAEVEPVPIMLDSDDDQSPHKDVKAKRSRPYKCNICGKTFDRGHRFDKHARKHVQNGFKCNVCKKRFPQRESLLNHMKTSHSSSGPRKHECLTCGKCFTEASHLEVHQQIHNGIYKPYKCGICEKGFIQLANLQKHIKIHIGG